MAPLIFNGGIDCIKLAKGIVSYLSNLEQNDMEVVLQIKKLNKWKKQKRNRDKEFKKEKQIKKANQEMEVFEVCSKWCK